MTDPLLLGVSGAAGRMGTRIIALAAAEPERFKLVAAMDSHRGPMVGRDAGEVAGAGRLGVDIRDELIGTPRVLIDFSAPAGTRTLIERCVERKIAMVIGTTGLTPDDHARIDTAAKSIAILQATNTSLGVQVLLAAAAMVARQLGPEYDIEIVEAHHRHKKDAPSGTAKSLMESICAATGRDPNADVEYGRHGDDATRRQGTIGVHAVRMGDVVGEHTVYFATPGERVELKHVATTRDTFAHGALRAAAFIAGQKPGRYTMAQVLFG